MKNTKKLTVSAIATALGVVLMLIGAVFEPLDLGSACISSVLVAFIYMEIGSPYTYLVWLCTSLITALVYPSGLMWIMYLSVFGFYPIIKGIIEKLPRAVWWPLKLAFGAVSFSVLFVVCTFVLGVSLFEEGFFGLPSEVFYLLMLLLICVCFAAYDIFLTAYIRIYLARIRPKIKKLLK